MSVETEGPNRQLNDRRPGLGCAFSALAANTLLLGLLASSFSQGPYSSHEQEVWYRYGSIGFLLAGAVVPGIALLFGPRRSPITTVALTAWMLATLVAAFIYAIMSSGGV